MRTISFYLIGLATWALVACGKKTEEQSIDKNHHIAVKLVNVEQALLASEIHGAGLLSSSTEAKLSFKIGGVVQKIY
ncbi:MAG: efflux RND transporter periplasmic adaptor subunit, partial [Thermoflexibacteraceae bacterium]